MKRGQKAKRNWKKLKFNVTTLTNKGLFQHLPYNFLFSPEQAGLLSCCFLNPGSVFQQVIFVAYFLNSYTHQKETAVHVLTLLFEAFLPRPRAKKKKKLRIFVNFRKQKIVFYFQDNVLVE